RDFHVTGVQTCALPISLEEFRIGLWWSWEYFVKLASLLSPTLDPPTPTVRGSHHVLEGFLSGSYICLVRRRPPHEPPLIPDNYRSEERRVGKACRALRG